MRKLWVRVSDRGRQRFAARYPDLRHEVEGDISEDTARAAGLDYMALVNIEYNKRFNNLLAEVDSENEILFLIELGADSEEEMSAALKQYQKEVGVC